MKKKSIKKINQSFLKLSIPLFLFFSFISCSKESGTAIDNEKSSLAKINVIFKPSTYGDEGTLGTKASVNSTKRTTAATIQTNTVELSKDFLLLAELAPAENTPVVTNRLLAGNKKAVVEQGDVATDIRYKIAVYDEMGKYILEKDYVHGKERIAETFELPTGKSYSFIVYSVNSTTELPAIDFSDTNHKTLSTSTILVSGSQDFMYFRKELIVSASAANNLEVVLKHLLSQITTTIDASQTKYEITDINSTLAISHQPNAKINLSDGSITRSGSGTAVSITFPTTASMQLTSLPNIINAGTSNSVQFKISTITIGPLTQTNVTPFSNMTIAPGVKYQLKLTIVPTDEYLSYKGIPAVRINGNIWMQHNVGADLDVDPALSPQTAALFGDYYQWGRKTVVAGTTESYPNTNWSNTGNLPSNSWNMGTEQAPIKAAGDPCPTGYRVPTKTEMERLIDGTIASEKGSWLAADNNFTSAKVLTSKRRKDVVIYFPIQGGFGYGIGGGNGISPTNLIFRGVIGLYWLSTASESSKISQVYFMNTGINLMLGTENYDQQSFGENIRCIAE
jgi:Fibrobacter succinogenes major domain (Fib_succ_major).